MIVLLPSLEEIKNNPKYQGMDGWGNNDFTLPPDPSRQQDEQVFTGGSRDFDESTGTYRPGFRDIKDTLGQPGMDDFTLPPDPSRQPDIKDTLGQPGMDDFTLPREDRGFFSPDGSGRPTHLSREGEGIARETPEFGSARPRFRDRDTASSRPVVNRVDRFTSTVDSGIFNRGERPSTRPITLARDRVGVRPEGQSGTSASQLSGRTGGRQQFVGSRQVGTGTSFASASSANPNQSGSNSSWWSRGRDARFGGTPERQVPFGNPRQQLPRNFGGVEIDPNTLFGDDVLQRGQSDESFQAGKKPSSPIGRPDQAFNPFRSGGKGGPGSGPTPLIRQGVERGLQFAGALVPKLNAYVTTANMLYKGMDAVTRARTGQTLAERVSNPVATLERDAEQFQQQAAVNRAKRDEMVGGVKDWFVDKMGNVKKDVQTRQLRQAGLGTDVRGNVVSENQRIKAADEFIAGVENWEPLTDQSTFEDIPVVSDVGTVNEFGEVVPNLGVQDGDQIAATYGGNTPKPDMWDQIIKKIETHTPVKGSDDYPYYGRPGRGMGDRWKGSSLPGGDEVAQVASAGDLSGLGATNQPATLDLNNLTDAPPIPEPPTPEESLDDFSPPEQPSDYPYTDDYGRRYREELVGDDVWSPYAHYKKVYEDQGESGNGDEKDNDLIGDYSGLGGGLGVAPELPSENPQLGQQAKPFTPEPSNTGWSPNSDPGVMASQRAIDSAYSAYTAASNRQQNYLGGRTAGTQAEYNEYLRLAAISDAASKRLDVAYDQQARAMQAYTSSRS